MSALETIWWEVDYDDGTSISEVRGAKYGDINRPRLKTFRLRDTQGPLIELSTDDTRSGSNLVYRRRTTQVTGGDKTVFYLLGWVPQGPILGLHSETMQVSQAPEFIVGDPWFYPPVAHPSEGELWTTHPRRPLLSEFESTT